MAWIAGLPGVSVLPGGEEGGESSDRGVPDPAMALATAALNLATGTLRLVEVKRGSTHRKVCVGLH